MNPGESVGSEYDPSLVANSVTLTYIRNQLKRGYSPSILVVGRPRGGKSLTAIELAFKIAKSMRWKFNIDNSYYFGILKFLEEFKTLRSRIIVIDEIGVDLDAHEWFSCFNLAYNHLIQTQAIKNICYILVVPYASYVAKVHVPLIDIVGEKISRNRISFYKLTPNWAEFRPSKFIWRFYVETIKDIPLPPDKILKNWKRIERINKKELEERILNKLKMSRERGSVQELPPLISTVLRSVKDGPQL